MDRRLHPRYRLSRAVNVGISYGPTMAPGELVDFSCTGLHVTVRDQNPLLNTTPQFQWEFISPESLGKGMGRAVRVQRLLSGNTSLGLHISTDSANTLDDSYTYIAKQLADDTAAGAVRLRPSWRAEDHGIIEVFGKLHARLVRDFTHLIARGARVIDLSQCRDIDSGGIGLLAIAHEHHVAFSGATGRVKELLTTVDRFKEKYSPYRPQGQGVSPASRAPKGYRN